MPLLPIIRPHSQPASPTVRGIITSNSLGAPGLVGLISNGSKTVSGPMDSSNLYIVPSFSPGTVLGHVQQRQLHQIACCFATLSIVSTCVALYWFAMMRRNFRRDLILLLIVGDLWKSSWYLIMSIFAITATHPNPAAPGFCEASGYMLQVGVEACDVAIVLMSLHMVLQIFPPRHSRLGHEGLYRIRWWGFAVWILLPNLSASLAFLNHGQQGYLGQAGFCTLPLRPFWFRLALSWVPRYFVWFFIMGVAIRIYRHVGSEFTVFAQQRSRSASMDMSVASSCLESSYRLERPRAHSTQSNPESVPRLSIGDEGVVRKNDRIKSRGPPLHLDLLQANTSFEQGASGSVSPGSLDRGGDGSPGPFQLPPIAPAGASLAAPAKAPTDSRRNSRQISPGVFASDFAALNAPDADRRAGSTTTIESSTIRSMLGRESVTALHPADTLTAEDEAQRMLKRRRAAIQRQLGLLFIYPVIYCMMWVLPFVAHAMNYSVHFAQHPVFAMSALNVVCQCTMGTVDVCIFTWREKPWRHIPGSRGSFFGSFLFWEYAFGAEWYHKRMEQKRPSDVSVDDAKVSVADSGSGSSSSAPRGRLSALRPWTRRSLPGSTTPAAGSGGRHAAGRTPPPPMHRRAHSGGGVIMARNAELAHERLARERAEWEQSRRSAMENQEAGTATADGAQLAQQPGKREWWDRRMSVNDDVESHGPAPAEEV